MKHAPDHSDYEAWLLDRLEGNLTPAQEQALDDFLRMHPELAQMDDELPGAVPTGQAGLPAGQAGLADADKAALKRDLPPTGMPAAPIDDFLVARLEGDLAPEQEAALAAWLAAHPHDALAARVCAAARLTPAQVPYPHAAGLKRTLPPTGMPATDTLDDFLVARLEGDLSPDQEAALDRYLANDPQARHQWALMQRTRSGGDRAVAYPHKEELKHRGRVIAMGRPRTWWTPLRLAASVALLLGLGAWWLMHRPDRPAQQVAHTPTSPADTRPPIDTTTARTVPPEDAPAARTPPPAPVAAHAPQEPLPAPATAAAKPPTAVPPLEDPVTEAPKEHADERPAPEPAPVATPAEAPLAQHGPPVPADDDDAEQAAMASTVTATPGPMAGAATGMSVGELLAREVRGKVLDNIDAGRAPLDGNDALAAVDKGLRAVSGERAGLTVERDGRGARRRIELRLGRDLAISASR